MAIPPQSPGAPLPVPPQSPHEWRVVDVRDAAQVHAACAGMDAIVNVSVVRHDPVDAFRVNAVGAYNVMQAAVAHGIQRVVHTGPFMLGQRGGAGYDWDTFLVDDIPPRPGVWWVYLPSKLLGQEICRIFAEHYGLCVPTRRCYPNASPPWPSRGWTRPTPFAVRWQSTGCPRPTNICTSARTRPWASSPTRKQNGCSTGSRGIGLRRSIQELGLKQL
jgi:hypothetical protein